MTENRRRHQREQVNEPAAVHIDGETYQGTITSISESGVAVEFIVPQGESSMSFDIGSSVEIDAQSLDDMKDSHDGQVVRHYDGGFVINFDGYRVEKKQP